MYYPAYMGCRLFGWNYADFIEHIITIIYSDERIKKFPVSFFVYSHKFIEKN